MIKIPPGLKGRRGLLSAVIVDALKDLSCEGLEMRREAARFFLSPWYECLVEFLGLPDGALPKGLNAKELEEMAKKKNVEAEYELPMPLHANQEGKWDPHITMVANELVFAEEPEEVEEPEESGESQIPALPEDAPKWAHKLVADLKELEKKAETVRGLQAQSRERPQDIASNVADDNDNVADYDLPMPVVSFDNRGGR